jgi:uncharacterized protein with FMN-binding domain
MRSRSTVAVRSFAALSGLVVVGSLAGCSAESLAASVTGPKSASSTQAANPVAATPTATPTDPPTGTAAPTTAPTTAAKPSTSTAPSTAPTAAPTPTPTPSPSASVASSAYKDGNYSATGTYNSPGGKETMRVTLDLADDVITDLAVTSVSINSTAVPYENAFEGGIQSIVVGKDIDSINVGPVAGSSLSSIGFNRAITTIKASAKN